MMDQDDIEYVPFPTDSTGLQDENSQINISDVIEVIQSTDPNAQAMFNNVTDNSSAQSIQSHPQVQQNAQPSGSTNNTHSKSSSIRRNARVVITEQPAAKALRFRYECEGRSAGSIPGVSSTPENKTFPAIQILGYKGRAVVVVSCVTKDTPYRTHPHNLVGKEGCKKGVCTVEINSDTMSVTFSNLGIQCVKKRDIEEALRVREEIRVDPFRQGFSHRSQPSSIDLNTVRLCFQVFLESEQRGRFTVPLPPVVSDPIFDKKAMSDLVICKLSDASCSVAGGKDMILLCEKVAKEDISVRFFEEKDGCLVWEGYGDFQHNEVHKQVAISFRTPKYKSIEVEHPIKCYIQLKRPSDGEASDALPFEYLPFDSDTIELKRKRIKVGNKSNLLKHLQNHEQINQTDGHHATGMNIINITDPTIKTEPVDNNLSPYRLFEHNTTPSPQPSSPAGLNYLNPSTSYSLTSHTQFGMHPIFPHFSNTFQEASRPFNHMQNPFNIQPSTSNQTLSVKSMSTLNNLNTNFTYSNSIPTPPPLQLNTAEPITANLSSLLDMDSQQFTHINSADLSGLSLSLLDSKMDQEQPQENMTDSFTRFATDAIKELNDLNNLYNSNNNNNNSNNNNSHIIDQQ